MTVDQFSYSTLHPNQAGPLIDRDCTVAQQGFFVQLESPPQASDCMPRKGSKRHIVIFVLIFIFMHFQEQDEDPYSPRSKKRYEEKMSCYLGQLNISGENSLNSGPQIEEVESWFPDEQETVDIFDEGDMPYVEEPSTSEANDSETKKPIKICLSNELKNFIGNCKNETQIFKPSTKTGKEVLLWQPVGMKAFFDPSMYGRINEVEETDEDLNRNENDQIGCSYVTLPEDTSSGSPETMASSPLSVTGDSNECGHYRDEEIIDLTAPKDEPMDLE